MKSYHKMTFLDDLKKLSDDITIQSYFKTRNIFDFVTKYIMVDELLMTGTEKFKPDIISEQLKSIQQYQLQSQHILKNDIALTVNTLISELQSNKEDNIKNILDNFKDKIINLNSENINNYDRKTINIVSDLQKVVSNTLDAHTINQKINSIDSVITSLHANFSGANSSSKKGEVTENILYNNLISTFPSSEILNTSLIPNSGDILIKKENHPDILIDSKNFKRNVPKIDLDKFYKDCKSNNSSGILCNLNSGIANRENFQLDIQDGRAYVFLSNHEFNNSYFQAAVKMIYQFHDIIKDKKTDNIEIDNELYSRMKLEFNFKFQSFKNHLDIIKQNIKSLETISFTLLDDFFKKSTFTLPSKPIICNLCGTGFGTDKALKIHYKNKHPNPI